jgi:hypothetical protein
MIFPAGVLASANGGAAWGVELFAAAANTHVGHMCLSAAAMNVVCAAILSGLIIH